MSVTIREAEEIGVHLDANRCTDQDLVRMIRAVLARDAKLVRISNVNSVRVLYLEVGDVQAFIDAMQRDKGVDPKPPTGVEWGIAVLPFKQDTVVMLNGRRVAKER